MITNRTKIQHSVATRSDTSISDMWKNADPL